MLSCNILLLREIVLDGFFFLFLGWVLDPRDRLILGSRLMNMETGCFGIRSEIDFVVHFLPMEYVRNTVIPATNTYAAKSKALT